MSIVMNNQCLLCLLQRHLETADRLGDEVTAQAFARELLRLFADAPEGISTPWLSDKINALFVKFYRLDPDRYRQEKQDSNCFALERLPQIRQTAQASPDPVYAALQLSILGNYIDFAALRGEVDFSRLDTMIASAGDMTLDRETYRSFCRDLQQGRSLLILTDNAGEIVFDRVLAEEIAKAYPHVSVTFCVRGGPAANDATREDANLAGIPFPVIDNGTCIPGTVVEELSAEARQAMDTADVILSKGQGNCETLYGDRRNIYYAFLVKCSRFIDKFQQPKLTPMFTR